MKKLVVGLAAVPFLAGIAMAGQPVPLSDAQMDRVTAGYEAGVFNGASQYLEITAFEPPSATGILLEFPTLPGHLEDPDVTGKVNFQTNPCCRTFQGS
jgi:hypothetical protein